MLRPSTSRRQYGHQRKGLVLPDLFRAFSVDRRHLQHFQIVSRHSQTIWVFSRAGNICGNVSRVRCFTRFQISEAVKQNQNKIVTVW